MTPPSWIRLRLVRIGWVLGLILAASPPAAHGADEQWQVMFAPSYLSGDYGQGSTTTITYLPLSIQRLFRDGDISLVIPWVSITGDCSVTLLSGVPNVTQSQCGAPHPQHGRRRQTPNPVVTESGLGDIVLRGRYYLVEESDGAPEIALTGRVKFPTADADKGLGTGEFDEGGGIELTKGLFGNLVAYADAGYTFIGKPPGLDLRNQWYYDVGLGYSFTKDLSASVYYEEWRALLAGFQNPQDLLFSVNYTVTPAWRVGFSTLIGLSDGSPAYGLTGTLSFRF